MGEIISKAWFRTSDRDYGGTTVPRRTVAGATVLINTYYFVVHTVLYCTFCKVEKGNEAGDKRVVVNLEPGTWDHQEIQYRRTIGTKKSYCTIIIPPSHQTVPVPVTVTRQKQRKWFAQGTPPRFFSGLQAWLFSFFSFSFRARGTLRTRYSSVLCSSNMPIFCTDYLEGWWEALGCAQKESCYAMRITVGSGAANRPGRRRSLLGSVCTGFEGYTVWYHFGTVWYR